MSNGNDGVVSNNFNSNNSAIRVPNNNLDQSQVVRTQAENRRV